MSIFKAVTYKGNQIDTLKDKIAYLVNPEKTDPRLLQKWLQKWMEKELFPACPSPQLILSCVGHQCLNDFLFFSDVIMRNQRLRGTVWKKAYDHFIIRFDERDKKVPPSKVVEALQEILILFCFRTGGVYVGMMAAHFDTDIPHAHFLIDTIDIRNGHRRNLDRIQFYQLRCSINKILYEHDLSRLRIKPLDKKVSPSGRGRVLMLS